jgi:SUMO ligase MMS21 Smc5/6 complex component
MYSDFRSPLNNDHLEHCPIYCEPIFDKITTECGHSFEREALHQHVNQIKSCPLCRAPI